MEKNYGAIAIQIADTEAIKRACDKWETDKWLSNYRILKGENNWVTIFDENLEWGNIDIFIPSIFCNVEGVILSVEYYNANVRFKLWESGVCIGERTTGRDMQPHKNKRGGIKLFATSLGVKSNLISKVFAVLDADISIALMESLLQCQLIMEWEPINDLKVMNATCCPKTYIEEYLEQCTEPKKAFLDVAVEKTYANKHISIKGMFLGVSANQAIIFCQENGMGIFYFVNQEGKMKEELSVPSDVQPYYFWEKHYIGNGKTGFLTKDNEFVLYEQNHLLSKFPDVKRVKIPSWYAHMPDKNTIFMDWACYDVNSGEKKWEFPFPVGEKTYKKFLIPEMWHELPNGLFITQINIDQEIMVISTMNQYGSITNSISMKISYAYHTIGIREKCVYVFRVIEQSDNLAEITLYDFELNRIGNFKIKANMVDYHVCFDADNRSFYVLGNEKIIQVDIASGKEQSYQLLVNSDLITSWGMLANDICYVIKKEKELFLMDSNNNMQCIFTHKIRGYYLRILLLDTGNLLLISQDNRKEGRVILQEICFAEQEGRLSR